MPSVGWTRRRGTKARIAASGSRTIDRVEGQVRRVRRNRDGPGLDAGPAIADFEQAARANAQERVAAQALATLDRLEEVSRTAVVEAEEGADGRLEVGRARGAQQDRVGVGGVTLGLRQADRIGGAHRVASRIRNDLIVPGRKVVPSAVPPSFGDAALA